MREQTLFRHAGYEMRSHSETRWASMLDYLGIRWQYEVQAYHTRHGGYLPDFYLPDVGMFIEVKGPAPSQIEIDKGLDVEAASGSPVVFAHGRPTIDGCHLVNAFLDYYGGDHRMQYSLYEISQGLEAWAGKRFCAGFAYAGAIQAAPDAVHIGDVMLEVLDKMMGREAVEQRKREQHAGLNAQKGAVHWVSGLPEFVLCKFVEKAVSCR